MTRGADAVKGGRGCAFLPLSDGSHMKGHALPRRRKRRSGERDLACTGIARSQHRSCAVSYMESRGRSPCSPRLSDALIITPSCGTAPACCACRAAPGRQRGLQQSRLDAEQREQGGLTSANLPTYEPIEAILDRPVEIVPVVYTSRRLVWPEDAVARRDLAAV